MDNHGRKYTFWAKPVIETENGGEHYVENVNELLAIMEANVGDQASFCIATKDGKAPIATSFSQESYKISTQNDRDWWYSIGDSMAAITAYCTNDNDTYRMELSYSVQDVYDWERDMLCALTYMLT